MSQNPKRILIIGFFVLLWGGIIYYFINEYRQINTDYLGIQLSSEEVAADRIDYEKGIAFNVQDNLLNSEEVLLYEVGLKQNNAESVESTEAMEKPEIVEEEPPIQMCGEFPCYSDEDFIKIYDSFEEKSGLPILSKYIYDNIAADDYIREMAEARGYQKRVFAEEEDMVSFPTFKTLPEILEAYNNMSSEMAAQNIILHFVSGYRTSTHQRGIFKYKVGDINVNEIPNGNYDEKLQQVLDTTSIPGYSKHHSGYAVDFGCGDDSLVYTFDETECYEWMSQNNFENAKRFGFIPSYPNGVPDQGPKPEPWEYVWVGVENLK